MESLLLVSSDRCLVSAHSSLLSPFPFCHPLSTFVCSVLLLIVFGRTEINVSIQSVLFDQRRFLTPSPLLPPPPPSPPSLFCPSLSPPFSPSTTFFCPFLHTPPLYYPSSNFLPLPSSLPGAFCAIVVPVDSQVLQALRGNSPRNIERIGRGIRKLKFSIYRCDKPLSSPHPRLSFPSPNP